MRFRNVTVRLCRLKRLRQSRLAMRRSRVDAISELGFRISELQTTVAFINKSEIPNPKSSNKSHG
jgi:hypothetical protein